MTISWVKASFLNIRPLDYAGFRKCRGKSCTAERRGFARAHSWWPGRIAGLISVEAFMTGWIAAIMLAVTLLSAGAANDVAAATSLRASVHQPVPGTSDLSASRRRTRYHQRFASRRYYPPYQPYFYFDRPYYYAPAPFVPFNFGYTVPWW
jgi:hypothetical protein